MKNRSDKIRVRTNIFLEPLLMHLAKNNKICISRSKYIRYALINQLIRDGVKLSEKFAPFVNKIKSTS